MQTPVSLKTAERKVFQTTFADGLWDVFIGCFALQFAIAQLDVHNENTPDGRIFSIPAWQMGGKITQDGEKVILEIAIESLEREFSIEL
jgi:hypothetical protein